LADKASALASEVRLLRFYGFRPWARLWELRRDGGAVWLAEHGEQLRQMALRRAWRAWVRWRGRWRGVCEAFQERRTLRLVRAVFDAWRARHALLRAREAGVRAGRSRKCLAGLWARWRAARAAREAARLAQRARLRELAVGLALRRGREARMRRVWRAWRDARHAVRAERQVERTRQRLRGVADAALRDLEN
jgi:hypothetical protein